MWKRRRCSSAPSSTSRASASACASTRLATGTFKRALGARFLTFWGEEKGVSRAVERGFAFSSRGTLFFSPDQRARVSRRRLSDIAATCEEQTLEKVFDDFNDDGSTGATPRPRY